MFLIFFAYQVFSLEFVKFISNIFLFHKLAWKRDLERKGFAGKRLL